MPLVMLGLLAGASSCGENNDATPQVNPGQPPGQAGAVTTWEEVSLRFRCTFLDGLDCVSGKFVVTRDGQYAFENTSTRGQLTEAQLAELAMAANALVDNVGGVEQCERGALNGNPEVATEVVTLNPQNDGEVVLFEANRRDARRCFLGDEAEVERLRQVLTSLMRAYAPAVVVPPYDPCAGKSCGDSCTICPPSDPNCIETAVLKFCTRSGECRAGEPAACTLQFR